MEADPTLDTAGPSEDEQIWYAVDRHGTASFTAVLASLMREVDLDALCATIREFGLQEVAEQYLGALVESGRLHASEAAASLAEDRILAEDRHASPSVHTVTVADLADEFTRLDLTDPASSCR